MSPAATRAEPSGVKAAEADAGGVSAYVLHYPVISIVKFIPVGVMVDVTKAVDVVNTVVVAKPVRRLVEVLMTVAIGQYQYSHIDW